MALARGRLFKGHGKMKSSCPEVYYTCGTLTESHSCLQNKFWKGASYYHPPMELWKGNVFICVCPLVGQWVDLHVTITHNTVELTV